MSEEEHATMLKMKSNLSELAKMHSKLKQLFVEVPENANIAKQHKMVQIQAAELKLERTFKEIEHKLQETKQKLVQKLSNIKNEELQSNEAISDDSKELEALTDALAKITQNKQYLKDRLSACNEKIETVDNDQRMKRKQEIVEIGNEADEQFNAVKVGWQQVCEDTQRVIEQNNVQIEIDFVLNEKGRDRVLRDICNLGVIVHERYNAKEPNVRTKVQFEAEDDLQRRIAEKDAEIASLRKQVEQLLPQQSQAMQKVNDAPEYVEEKTEEIEVRDTETFVLDTSTGIEKGQKNPKGGKNHKKKSGKKQKRAK